MKSIYYRNNTGEFGIQGVVFSCEQIVNLISLQPQDIEKFEEIWYNKVNIWKKFSRIFTI